MRTTLELLILLRARLDSHGWYDEGLCTHIRILAGEYPGDKASPILEEIEAEILLTYLMVHMPKDILYLQDSNLQHPSNRSDFYWWDPEDVESRKEFLDSLIEKYPS